MTRASLLIGARTPVVGGVRFQAATEGSISNRLALLATRACKALWWRTKQLAGAKPLYSKMVIIIIGVPSKRTLNKLRIKREMLIDCCIIYP